MNLRYYNSLLIAIIFSCGFANSQTLSIKSKYQPDSTKIHILETYLSKDKPLHLVFVLPVEKQKTKYKFGSGFAEFKKLNASHKLKNNVVIIQPDFTHTPWFCNHPTDSTNQQEAYTLECINLIKEKYKDYTQKVYCVGFSKSGWGSMSLVMKYPQLIDGIFVWDAPLATDWNEKWHMSEGVGTKNHFMENYAFANRTNEIKNLKRKTIVVGGYDLFKDLSTQFVQQLRGSGVYLKHLSNIDYPHVWSQDWMYTILQNTPIVAN